MEAQLQRSEERMRLACRRRQNWMLGLESRDRRDGLVSNSQQTNGAAGGLSDQL